jgi:uncharacterized protein YbjT (DUF2867 family)
VIDPEDRRSRRHRGWSYFLTGPVASTAREQVDILADVTGRSIEFEDVTPHEFDQAAIEPGTSPEQAHFIERLNELFPAGRAGFVTDDVENITGPGRSAPGANATRMPSVCHLMKVTG